MAKKLGDCTPTQIMVKLLVCLLENDRFYTLSELAEKFEISKPIQIRALERQYLIFFGKLIKERLEKEVAYKIDKSKLLSKLMLTHPKSDSQNKSLSIKNKCEFEKAKCANDTWTEEIAKLNIGREASLSPLVLSVFEYMFGTKM